MNINDSVQKSGPLSTNMCSVCVLPVHKGEGDNCPNVYDMWLAKSKKIHPNIQNLCKPTPSPPDGGGIFIDLSRG